MSFRFVILTLLASLPLAGASHAADYSQDGVYVLEPQPAPASADDKAKLQLTCALTFYKNQKSGAFEQFFLDKQKFQTKGEVSYLESRAGVCKQDDATKLETCQTKYAADGKIGDEPATYNSYSLMSAERMTAYYFGSPDEFTKWKAAGSDAKQGSWSQVKCADITDDTLKGHLSQDINPLSADDTAKRLFVDAPPSADDYAMARKVMDVLKAKP